MTSSLAQPIVITSLAAAITALVAGVFAWLTTRKKDVGDYTEALMRASRILTEQFTEANKELKDSNRELSQKLDRLEQHVDRIEDLLLRAIADVEAAGDLARAEAMRDAVRRTETQRGTT